MSGSRDKKIRKEIRRAVEDVLGDDGSYLIDNIKSRAANIASIQKSIAEKLRDHEKQIYSLAFEMQAIKNTIAATIRCLQNEDSSFAERIKQAAEEINKEIEGLVNEEDDDDDGDSASIIQLPT